MTYLLKEMEIGMSQEYMFGLVRKKKKEGFVFHLSAFTSSWDIM